MFHRDHLGKALGLGGIFFVAPRAQSGNIWQRGFKVHWIGYVLGLGPVTAFAGNVRVFAGGTRVRLILVTSHAHGLARECERPLTNEVRAAGR